jgi:hypothetical protein
MKEAGSGHELLQSVIESLDLNVGSGELFNLPYIFSAIAS